MDFTYTETQDMLRDTLARFLADTYDFDKRQKMIASSGGRDPGIWKALATDLGILSAPFSEEQGGLGGGTGCLPAIGCDRLNPPSGFAIPASPCYGNAHVRAAHHRD